MTTKLQPVIICQGYYATIQMYFLPCEPLHFGHCDHMRFTGPEKIIDGQILQNFGQAVIGPVASGSGIDHRFVAVFTDMGYLIEFQVHYIPLG